MDCAPYEPTSFTIMVTVINVGADVDYVALRVLGIWQ
jgi:hypothetical protein